MTQDNATGIKGMLARTERQLASSRQCPAVNDGMEGVRCHGDAGHAELHWADISGDGGVTEWGDNEELWEEVDRLRAVIENAPHYVDADGWWCRADAGDKCTCWKAQAL